MLESVVRGGLYGYVEAPLAGPLGRHDLREVLEVDAIRRLITLPDPTYSFIRALERLGWASRLRIPSERAMLARVAGASRPERQPLAA